MFSNWEGAAGGERVQHLRVILCLGGWWWSRGKEWAVVSTLPWTGGAQAWGGGPVFWAALEGPTPVSRARQDQRPPWGLRDRGSPRNQIDLSSLCARLQMTSKAL